MMNVADSISQRRAQMPSGAHRVIDRRTLEHGNKNLLPLVKSGMSVLDVGCGAGTITKGIAERVGNAGSVVGLDMSSELIAMAKDRNDQIPQLSFVSSEIMKFNSHTRFDLVTAARTLQWIGPYRETLIKMKSLLKRGGCLSVLDYNHEKIKWEPAPPVSMLHFYESFLNWRNDAGMSNSIADDMEDCFSSLGLGNISVSDEHELSVRSDADFREAAGIWKQVADLRGPQMVADGCITEEERRSAVRDYDDWLENKGNSMRLYLLATVGYA